LETNPLGLPGLFVLEPDVSLDGHGRYIKETP
jgi:hypothetical protein